MRRADGITRTESAVPTSTMSVQFDHDLYGVHESESAVEVRRVCNAHRVIEPD